MKINPTVILLVEDDPEMRSLLCDELWDLSCRIVEARDGHEALQQIEKMAPDLPDLIVTDLRMPAGGLDYIARLRTLAPRSPIILLTAFGGPATKTGALRAGVSAYFDKPVRLVDLKGAIRRLLDHDGKPDGSGAPSQDAEGKGSAPMH